MNCYNRTMISYVIFRQWILYAIITDNS